MKKSELLGPLENACMDVMWQLNRATVRQVMDRLEQRHTTAYTTVMTVMNNLFKKGLLERTSQGKAYVYKAALTRQAFIERKSREAVSDVLARFGDIAIAHFLETTTQLKPGLLKRLEKLAQRGESSQTEGESDKTEGEREE